jgi:hypothetical protein
MEPRFGSFNSIYGDFQRGFQLAMLDRVAYCRFQKPSAAFPPFPPAALEDWSFLGAICYSSI